MFEHKAETDANYERCVRLLHDHHGDGARRLRHAQPALARLRGHVRRGDGHPDTGYEVQMLYGMAEPMQAAVRRIGLRLRVYAPVGELVPGMAYLVRRLLENTSNESFVRHRFAEGRQLDELLAPPTSTPCRSRSASPTGARPTRSALSPYEPEPVSEWQEAAARASFAAAVDAAGRPPVLDVPAVIDGERVAPASTIDSVDPGRFERVVARSASCDGDRRRRGGRRRRPSRSSDGGRRRRRSGPASCSAPPRGCAHRRNELAAIEVFEAGKPWDQADADVCEAIDFCEYYGREMLRLDSEARGGVQSPPGERNRLTTRARASRS